MKDEDLLFWLKHAIIPYLRDMSKRGDEEATNLLKSIGEI